MLNKLVLLVSSMCFLLFPFYNSYAAPNTTNLEKAPKKINKPRLDTPQSGTKPIYWYENGVKRKVWISKDELAIFSRKDKKNIAFDRNTLTKQAYPKTVATKKNSLIKFLKLPAPLSEEGILAKLASDKTLREAKRTNPVFYASSHKCMQTRTVPTGEIIVKFKQEYTKEQVAVIEARYGLTLVKTFKFTPNTFLYKTSDSINSINIANVIYELGYAKYAYPNCLRSYAKFSIPNDTLFPEQWHLNNTGQNGGTPGEDVNITSVWNTYKGSTNIVVAILDDGLEVGHEDLSANIAAGLSWDYIDNDSDPTAGKHGTSCAGVAAGRGFNNQGISGAAPHTGLAGLRFMDNDGNATDVNILNALSHESQNIDIYNNSWGPDGGLAGPSDLTLDALASGVGNGRGGLGSIYIYAAGNGRDYGNTNYNGYANSRFTITVAASTNYGKRASYSGKGANVLINAPSNGGSMDITTTDRTGSQGFDLVGNYNKHFTGTSSAAPLVSGIVALMLEANPSLTWRDVQHILIETAEKNDPLNSDWFTNSAGYHVSDKNGFGRVDAQAAVNAAENWVSADVEVMAEGSSSPNAPIPDNSSIGTSDTINITGNIKAEFVEIYFTASDHTSWGNLEVTLTSPGGTKSILSREHFSGITPYIYNNWRFGSVQYFGEFSQGSWTLTVKDLVAGDIGTFKTWSLKVYGTVPVCEPGALEICNGIDDNCDYSIDEGFTDTDGDGISDCVDSDDDGDGSLDIDDCAPLVDSVYAGALEICDGIDNNCDGDVEQKLQDGTYSIDSNCSNTQNNTPNGEDVNNAAQLDDDNDGVKNNVDLCSNTPLGTPVDKDGCQLLEPKTSVPTLGKWGMLFMLLGLAAAAFFSKKVKKSFC